MVSKALILSAARISTSFIADAHEGLQQKHKSFDVESASPVSSAGLRSLHCFFFFCVFFFTFLFFFFFFFPLPPFSFFFFFLFFFFFFSSFF